MKNDTGITALWIASWKRHIEVIELLLENGAEADVKNINGLSALDAASQE
ncbi:MAG: ankyrin repeat domain-containing protein [Verrucomicrobiota bacterium]